MTIIHCPPLPADTELAAKLAFEQKHPYIKIGNQLDALLNDLQLSKAILGDEVLFASFWPLAAMTILQFRENLSDCQADVAIKTRLDLKYALHLPLDFPGFAPMVLCKFRQRLFNNSDAKIVFQVLIKRTNELIGIDNQHLQDTDQALITICALNRLEAVFEAMSSAVEILMATHPESLQSIALPHWYRHYRHAPTFLSFRRSIQKMEELLQYIGEDGRRLLEFVNISEDTELGYLPAIQILRQEWQRQFEQQKGSLTLRPLNCALCNEYPKMTKEGIYASFAKYKEENEILKKN